MTVLGTDISAAFGGGSGSSGFRGGAKEKLSPAMLLNLFLKMKPVEVSPHSQGYLWFSPSCQVQKKLVLECTYITYM